MGLKSAASFRRSQLAHRLNLRITPELTFVRDNGIAHGAQIAAILSNLHLPETDSEEAEADGDEEGEA